MLIHPSQHPETRAWTGGSSPRPFAHVTGAEERRAIALHLEQCATWRAYWGDAPDADVKATFWNRARHDAHATFRHVFNPDLRS